MVRRSWYRRRLPRLQLWLRRPLDDSGNTIFPSHVSRDMCVSGVAFAKSFMIIYEASKTFISHVHNDAGWSMFYRRRRRCCARPFLSIRSSPSSFPLLSLSVSWILISSPVLVLPFPATVKLREVLREMYECSRRVAVSQAKHK